MNHSDTSKTWGRTSPLSWLLTGILSLVLHASLLGEDNTKQQTEPFPDTTVLLDNVIQHERKADRELQSLVFKDDITVSEFDATGQLRTSRTEIRYFSGSGYHPFGLHIRVIGNSIDLPFSEILGSSRLVPLQWSELRGTRVMVYCFEPQLPVAKHGHLASRLAADLKGTIWVNPDDASIVRFEFRTVWPISLGWGYLGNIDSLAGSLEMRDAGSLWLPERQEYVTRGKKPAVVVAGVRFRKKFHTRQTDQMSRYEQAFEMVPAKPSLVSYGE
jgi:hypothetical protein